MQHVFIKWVRIIDQGQIKFSEESTAKVYPSTAACWGPAAGQCGQQGVEGKDGGIKGRTEEKEVAGKIKGKWQIFQAGTRWPMKELSGWTPDPKWK